jgi:pimeloyl-ACP methyl ester carboxylesterase
MNRLIEKANAHSVVIFVHGLGGDLETTWGNFPFLIQEDTDLAAVAIFLWGYPSGFVGNVPNIWEASRQLQTEIRFRLSKYNDIVLVGHSLGGLVIRAMVIDALKNGRRDDIKTVKHIVTFGTPNDGSQLASIASYLHISNAQVTALGVTSNLVSELRGEWVNRVYAPNIELGQELTKRKIPLTAVVGVEDTIVTPESARSFFQDPPPESVPGDHKSMKLPQSLEDTCYLLVKKVLSGPSEYYSSAKPGVVMDISVWDEDASSWNRGEKTILRYSLERNEHLVRIESNLGYLASFKAGGPITPLNYLTPTGCAFWWHFPILDFKFVNNGPTTLFFKELVFDIEASRPDRTAFFTVKRDTQQRYAGNLLLINEGGCDLTDVTISFHLFPGEVAIPAKYDPPYLHSVALPFLGAHDEIDVTQAFQDEGVDIEGLILLQTGEWESESREIFVAAPKFDGSRDRIVAAELDDRIKRYLGPFQDWVGTLAGQISFAAAEDPGRRRQVKFQAVVYLKNRNLMGIPRPPTFAYDVVFDGENTRYQRRVKIPHEIKSGETDRFTVKIAVPLSSFHRFRTTIHDISGQTLNSLPIEMNCFVPRYLQAVVGEKISSPPSG